MKMNIENVYCLKKDNYSNVLSTQDTLNKKVDELHKEDELSKSDVLVVYIAILVLQKSNYEYLIKHARDFIHEKEGNDV